MIRLEGEVTGIACPPNKADQLRVVTAWMPETQEHVEFTVLLSDFQKSELREGNKIQISINKV